MIAIPFAFIFLMICLVGYSIYAATVLEKKHQTAMAKFAKRHGLHFSAGSRGDTCQLVFKGELGNRGRSQQIAHVMEGDFRGHKICLFDFKYVTGSGKRRSTHRQTVLITPAPAGLPSFQLRPENVFHKIGKAFGYQDIDFSSHPTFSKRYLLRGNDEKAIRQAFTSPVMSRLEQVKCLCMESTHNQLIIWHDDRRQKITNLENFIMLSLAVAHSFDKR